MRPIRVLLAACSLFSVAAAQPPAAPPPPEPTPPVAEVPRDQRWREDIDFLASELPKRHINAFFKCKREDFDAAAAALRDSITSRSDADLTVGLMRLAAMLGDAHTGISPGVIKPPFHYFPLAIYWFSDGPVIAATRASEQDLIGCTLVRFGDTPAVEALQRVAPVFAYENEATFRNNAPRYLITAEVAQACGLINDAERVTITIRDAEGKERTAELAPMAQGERLTTKDQDNPKLPLYRQKRGQANWYELLPEEKALYFQYGRCADDPSLKVIALTNDILGAIDANNVERVIVDLRNNSGGNSAYLLAFIQGLKFRERLHKPGGVIVLIGRGTFSSAQLNAAKLKSDASATLIGEPTGQKPNAYGEVRSFTLPHSKIPVNYSTKHFQTESGDRPSMEPDVRVELSSTDYFALRDPVLDAALNYKP
jgi:Peptidase family S41